jgi:arsenate reductase (thioredoxin)
MAEGFARAYGADVLLASSAGLAPALAVQPLTHKVMLEKNIDLGPLYPKSIDMLHGEFDLVVNMSGHKKPIQTKTPIEDWDVRDPIGEPEEVYRQVRDEIEQRVMRLVLSLRSRKPQKSEAPAEEVPVRKTHAQAGPVPVDTRRRSPRQ